MINYDFTDKVVVITGASMGLGKAIATEFAKSHANIVVADLNIDEANNITAQNLGVDGGQTY